MRMRLATQEDLGRIYGSANLLIGRPVKPEPESTQQQRSKLRQAETPSPQLARVRGVGALVGARERACPRREL
jgi:hypothetical protein